MSIKPSRIEQVDFLVRVKIVSQRILNLNERFCGGMGLYTYVSKVRFHDGDDFGQKMAPIREALKLDR